MSGLRIAVIGLRGVPATWGGIERHVEEIGARLAAADNEVTVFCRTNYSAERLPEYRGMRLVHLPTVSSKHLDAIVHSALATAAAFGRGYDIVQYHALGPGTLAPLPRYLSRAKVVQTIHGRDDERSKWGGAAQRLLRAAGWMSGHVPDATVVVSRALETSYQERYGREAVYIPNGVEEPPTAPGADDIEARFGLTPRSFLLFVGRLVPEKAPDALIRAFGRIPGDLRLVIAGGSSFTDDYTAHLGALASADPRVVMAGYVHGKLLAELYANAAAFVLPSTLEGLPLTLLEAASYATPVIVSDIAPNLEIVGQEGPGHRVFSAGNEDGLVGAIQRSLEDADAERRGAAALRSRVLASYSWDQAAEATERLYRRVLAT